MTKNKENLLRLPQGTEGFSLEEALIHRKIIRQLEKLYFSWGYLPANTPVFDFFDIYSPLLEDSAKENSYRLIDREGDLLLLRSDITLFLAKQIGTTLHREDLPARIFYADSILRHQDRVDISKNEFFQAGAELIGETGINGELEILMLLIKNLEMLNLPETFIHIGSRAFLDSLTDGFDKKAKNQLIKAVSMRENKNIIDILESNKISNAEVFTELFNFIGSPEELSALINKNKAVLNIEITKELEYLSEIMKNLKSLDADKNIRIDLSEVGTQSYHTGIVFQAYLEGVDSAIASGGRYDKLLKFFGFDTPSVGYSILLRKLEPKIKDKSDFLLSSAPEKIKESSFVEAYKKADKIRKNGGLAVL